MNAELVRYVLANMLASHNCQLTHTYFSPNLDCQQECRLAGGYKEESLEQDQISKQNIHGILNSPLPPTAENP